MSTFKILWSCTLPLIVIASTEVATLNHYGITFTPTNIIASRLGIDGSVELIKHPASHEDRSFFQDTIRNIDRSRDRDDYTAVNEPIETNATIDMFRNAIAPVNNRLQSQLGLKPTYASLFLPSIFHNSVISAAATAILPAYEENINTRHGPHRLAALYGFHFLEGKNIGRAPDECDDYCPEIIVLLLEYERDYVYAWLMIVDVELGVYYPQAKKLRVECGERYREVSA